MPTTYTSAAQSVRRTSQQKPIIGKDMVENNAGGYTFKLSPMARVRRFLILGSDSNTYYQRAQDLTDENMENLFKALVAPGGSAILTMMEEVSHQGLAPRVSPVLFALAAAMSCEKKSIRTYAAKHSLPIIIRTNSHMLEFISYVDEMRGWGRLLREAVGDWYNNMPADKLAYQVAKYHNRKGWTTRDALRMSKPVPADSSVANVYSWAVGKPSYVGSPPPLLQAIDDAADKAGACSDYRDLQWAGAHVRNNKLTREMLPTEWLRHKEIWGALMPNMPMTAMIRNLGKMTEVGALRAMSREVSTICALLRDPELIARARVHPFQVLLALTTYAEGTGVRGSLEWDPISSIVEALNEAYHLAFQNIVPAEKRTLMAIDISPSMNASISNTHLSCMQAAGAMAMATIATEPYVETVAFASGNGRVGWNAEIRLEPLPLTKTQRLDDVAKVIQETYARKGFCATDCALPMLWAEKKKLEVDTFVIITDNETFFGDIHPTQALELYRRHMGIDAKLVVVGMTSTGFSIADPKDKGMLDVVGFDSSAPRIIADFSRGDI